MRNNTAALKESLAPKKEKRHMQPRSHIGLIVERREAPEKRTSSHERKSSSFTRLHMAPHGNRQRWTYYFVVMADLKNQWESAFNMLPASTKQTPVLKPSENFATRELRAHNLRIHARNRSTNDNNFISTLRRPLLRSKSSIRRLYLSSTPYCTDVVLETANDHSKSLYTGRRNAWQ